MGCIDESAWMAKSPYLRRRAWHRWRDCQFDGTSRANVVVGDVLDDLGRQTVGTINAAGGQAEYVHLDVTKEEDWIAAVNTATGGFGKLDILVNNAGVFIGKGSRRSAWTSGTSSWR